MSTTNTNSTSHNEKQGPTEKQNVGVIDNNEKRTKKSEKTG